MQFVPSPQQAGFFDWVDTGTGSCVLEAVAGAGKTSTLIEALARMQGRIFFGAYNKQIAAEIAARAPKREGLFIKTMHAAGLGAFRRVAPRTVLNANKCRDIFRTIVMSQPMNPEIADYEGPVLSLVSYAKQAAAGVVRPLDDAFWSDTIDHFDVDTMGQDDVIVRLATKVLATSKALDMTAIDFDDMIYAPLNHRVRLYGHDWVLIDEAQDTNASRRALALGMLNRGGRLVAVGDRHQAIYGFTGADSDALDLIGAAVSAIKMPLTTTYRCPKAVVVEAQKYVSHIQAAATAPDGIVDSLNAALLGATAKPGDAILCRFNAPLLSHVYSFIANGIPAKIEGREIGTGLKSLARRWKAKTYPTLLTRLEAHSAREAAKYRAKEQESRATGVEDKVNCLVTIIERVQKTEPNPADCLGRLCAEIDTIFGDQINGECVLLSSIHKSKGREWHRTFWLTTKANQMARMPWEKQQEVNLCYVAATRAKAHLTLVE